MPTAENTTETPATETPENEAPETTEENKTEVPADILSDIRIGTEILPMRETVIPKGKGKGETRYYIDLDFNVPPEQDAFAGIKRAVGVENWNRTIYTLVRQACNDATHDASKDGVVSDEDWAKQFIEQFVAGSRRSGIGVKQLRDKQTLLFGQIQPLLLKQAHGEKLTPDDNMRLLQLLSDFSEVNETIEKKTRKGLAKKEKKEKADKAKTEKPDVVVPA